MLYIPNRNVIREERMRMKLSIKELQEMSRLSEKTIRNIEGGRTQTMRERTLIGLADALDCEKDLLVKDCVHGRERFRPVLHPPHDSPPSSRHDSLVLIEQRRSPRLPSAETEEGVLEPLTALWFQRIRTCFGLHERCRWWVPAWVRGADGLTSREAGALGCALGTASRFLVERPITRRHCLTLTIHSPSIPVTCRLFAELCSEQMVPLVCRVVVANEPVFRHFGESEISYWTIAAERILTQSPLDTQ